MCGVTTGAGGGGGSGVVAGDGGGFPWDAAPRPFRGAGGCGTGRAPLGRVLGRDSGRFNFPEDVCGAGVGGQGAGLQHPPPSAALRERPRVPRVTVTLRGGGVGWWCGKVAGSSPPGDAWLPPPQHPL